MRVRTGSLFIICCCAGLAACTATAPKGPNTVVSTPAVGRPQPPVSAQAAFSSEAFTPYAALSQSNNDGLAPRESVFVLTNACMNGAGYANNAFGPRTIAFGPGSLAFAFPWGDWGYPGVAEAEQYGFRFPPGTALSQLGVDVPTDAASLPRAEGDALRKCDTIVQDFTNAAEAGPLAGIQTLSNDIYNDVLHDAAVENAMQAWSACMAKNGYSFRHPQDVFYKETPNALASPVNPTARKAEIAAAVSDADCTQSVDLAGIYFAVQASYEQQLVNANQQALTAAVQQYRALYAKYLSELAALMGTSKAQPAHAQR